MNPDITAIEDMQSLGMVFDPKYFLFTTIIIIIVSHFGAKYLMTVTPRGYWFWFTIINIIVGFMFL